MRKVAVTGGVATGKSTACQILKELGAYTINSDEIVHQLLSPETEIGKKVIALLGHEIVVDGKIQRERIAEIVFQEKPLLEALEKLLHPEVQKMIDSQFCELSQKINPSSLFVAEVPLLFEAHLEEHYDAVILITADVVKSRTRFMKKGFSQEEYDRRQSRFSETTEKIKKSKYVVENNKNYDEFKKSLINIYQELIKEI